MMIQRRRGVGSCHVNGGWERAVGLCDGGEGWWDKWWDNLFQVHLAVSPATGPLLRAGGGGSHMCPRFVCVCVSATAGPDTTCHLSYA